MGNIMICGSLCDSCSVSAEQKEREKQNNIEHILVKEVFEREKIVKIIDKEINNLHSIIFKNDTEFKEKCDQIKKNIYNDLSKLEIDSNQNISQIESHIEKIKDNHLYHIEKDINIIKTKFENVNEDIIEIKDVLKELNRTSIRNATKLDLLKI